jgi:hypothetical protein
MYSFNNIYVCVVQQRRALLRAGGSQLLESSKQQRTQQRTVHVNVTRESVVTTGWCTFIFFIQLFVFCRHGEQHGIATAD